MMMFLLSVQSSFYIMLSSYVERHVKKKIKSEFHIFGWFPGPSKIWMFFWEN